MVSVAGLWAAPFMAPYNASKHAAEVTRARGGTRTTRAMRQKGRGGKGGGGGDAAAAAAPPSLLPSEKGGVWWCSGVWQLVGPALLYG